MTWLDRALPQRRHSWPAADTQGHCLLVGCSIRAPPFSTETQPSCPRCRVQMPREHSATPTAVERALMRSAGLLCSRTAWASCCRWRARMRGRLAGHGISWCGSCPPAPSPARRPIPRATAPPGRGRSSDGNDWGVVTKACCTVLRRTPAGISASGPVRARTCKRCSIK